MAQMGSQSKSMEEQPLAVRSDGRESASVYPNTGADFNGDGAVNTADLVLFLERFGGECA